MFVCVSVTHFLLQLITMQLQAKRSSVFFFEEFLRFEKNLLIL